MYIRSDLLEAPVKRPPIITSAQRFILRRLAAGDSVAYRLNFMFCPTESSKYVHVFRSDLKVAPQHVLSALFAKGYVGIGYVITDAGRTALGQ